jgi:hypothetical protein
MVAAMATIITITITVTVVTTTIPMHLMTIRMGNAASPRGLPWRSFACSSRRPWRASSKCARARQWS